MPFKTSGGAGTAYTPPATWAQAVGGAGFGSTNTRIRRFTSLNVNSGGSDITYTASAANGDSFTINTTGIYAITYADTNSTTGGALLGISKNATGTDLTTDVDSLQGSAPAKVLIMASASQGISGVGTPVTITVPLTAADVIRAHNSGTRGSLPNATDNTVSFTVTRIA